MRRGESVFEIDPNAHEEVERGFEVEGSNLSGVSARCSWSEDDPSKTRQLVNKPETEPARITEEESEQIKSALQKGLHCAAGPDQDRGNYSFNGLVNLLFTTCSIQNHMEVQHYFVVTHCKIKHDYLSPCLVRHAESYVVSIGM